MKKNKTNDQYSTKKYNKLLKKLNYYEDLSKENLFQIMVQLTSWKPNNSIVEARKKSIFRYGGYNSSETIVELIDILLNLNVEYSKENVNYLKTKKNLFKLQIVARR